MDTDNPPPTTETHPPAPTTLAGRSFPLPPYYYKAFTNDSWNAFKAHKERQTRGALDGAEIAEEEGENSEAESSKMALSRARDLALDLDIFQKGNRDKYIEENREGFFVPPRADWVKDEGRWKMYGEGRRLATGKDANEISNAPNFRPPGSDMSDKQYLNSLLHSLLLTKLNLLKTMTKTLRPLPQLQYETQHENPTPWAPYRSEGEPYIRHMEELARAMIIVTNDLRDAQGRHTLEMMMRSQLQKRKDQTMALNDKCEEVARKIEAMKAGIPTNDDVPTTTKGKKRKEAEGDGDEDVDMDA